MDFISELPADVVLTLIFPRLNYRSCVRAGAVNREWRSLAAQATSLGDDIPYICPADQELGRHVRVVSINQTDFTTYFTFNNHSTPISIPLDHPSTDKLVFSFNSKTGNSFPLPVAPGKRISSAFFCPTLSDDHSGPLPENWAAAALDTNPTNLVYLLGPGRTQRFHARTILHDLIFYKYQLYCINQYGEIIAFDLSDICRPPRAVISRRKDDYSTKNLYITYYLVESSSGELHIVARDASGKLQNSTNYAGPTFSVRKVDEMNGKLVDIEDLGDQMYFVEQGCSKSIMYGSRAAFAPFLKPNCIYFFYNTWDRLSVRYRCKVGMYSMEREAECCNRISLHQSQLPVSSLRPLWIHLIP